MVWLVLSVIALLIGIIDYYKKSYKHSRGLITRSSYVWSIIWIVIAFILVFYNIYVVFFK